MYSLSRTGKKVNGGTDNKGQSGKLSFADYRKIGKNRYFLLHRRGDSDMMIRQVKGGSTVTKLMRSVELLSVYGTTALFSGR